jgi:hypothetical protein
MAWLAKCGLLGNFLHHGADVEVRGDGFFEGAWSGRFEDWDFASAGTVAGRARLRRSTASCSSLHRIHSRDFITTARAMA